ncbi:PAS domain-containing protein [Halococcus sp. IIIV-5B]|uniref:PAS domain-containing protein n=1 Tax=Halococcus sp. IIIV-5B TaxID=2321230 RepID=UPI001F318FD9|nr:PAS domain-containing protein [Halococcus sp. IIIV-5B]
MGKTETVRILHVDDEPGFAEMVSTFLERERDAFDVVTAMSARDGLQYLTEASGSIDCIVSDYDMPETDGLEFLESVRVKYPNIPFILFTGRGSEEIASEAITAGVSEYLNKQNRTNQYTVLANRIDNLVSQYHAERELKATNKRVRNLYTGLTDAIFALDTEGRFTHLNARAEELLERSEEELLGTSIKDEFPAGVGTKFESEIKKAFREDHPVEFEEYYPPLDTYYQIRAVPTTDGLTFHVNDVAEKRERELKIQRQNERLQTVLDNLPVVLFTVDEQGTVLLSEGQGLAGIGLDPGDLVGESVFDLYPEMPIAEDVRQAINGETAYSTGTFAGRFFEMWSQPVKNGDEIEDEGIAIANDITDQNAYQRNLREEEAFTESILDAIPDILYAFDREGTLLRWNEQLSVVTGYSDAEITEMKPLDFIADKDAEELQKASTAVFADGSVTTHQVSFVTKSDRHIQMELTAAPITDESGSVIGLTGTGRTIADRHEHEKYRRQLYETAADTDLTIDETIERMLGLGCEYLGLESGFLTNVENGTQRIVKASSPHEALQPGKECPLSESYCRKTLEMDELLTVAHAEASGWSGDPAYDRFGPEAYAGAKLTVDGDRYGTVCFADRSPRQDEFTAIEQLFIELVARGVESALERHKHDIELEQQNERLQKFAGVLSHDLRNPLAVANGFLELARETGEDEYFNRIGTAHDRIDAIIEDVLTLARHGETIGEMRSIDLKTLVTEAWENVESKDAELVMCGNLGGVDADKSRLKQLFENLYRNAIEHAGEYTTVRVGRFPAGFYVEDDGPGVPESDRDSIFDSAYTTSDEGTGLGLSIVETIATAHGWKIRVVEGTDGGARFEVLVKTMRGGSDDLSLTD